MRWPRLFRCLALAAVVVGAPGLLTPSNSSAAGSSHVRWSSIRWHGDQATGRLRSGQEVPIGLDHELQEDLKHRLARAKPIAGAAALVSARDGQVLAAAEIGETEGGSLLFDPVAPAASVFKIVTTTALYERTSVTPTTRVCTQGGLRGIEREHLVRPTGGDVVCSPFAHALGVSRNAAYAQLATRELMRDDLREIAESFGFNAGLPGDVLGRTGTIEVPYNDLAFARTAAGFQNSRLSVFGGAELALVVASGGELVPLSLRKLEGEGEPGPRVMTPHNAYRLRKAMEVTIHSGTARDSFVDSSGRGVLGPIQVAGKTGTLQPQAGAPTASWFIGFAPSENPLVVVSVLLQNPARWHQKGHQLGRDLLQNYFARMGVRGVDAPP